MPPLETRPHRGGKSADFSGQMLFVILNQALMPPIAMGMVRNDPVLCDDTSLSHRGGSSG